MPSHYCSPESRFSKVFGTVLPVKCATRARFAGLPGPMSLFTAQGMPVVGMLKALFLVALLGFGFVVASADAQTSRDYAVRDLRLTQQNTGALRVEWREPMRKFRISAGYRVTWRSDDGQSPNISSSSDVLSGRDGRGRYLGNARTNFEIFTPRGRRYLVTVEPLTLVWKGPIRRREIGVFPDTAVSKRFTLEGIVTGTTVEDVTEDSFNSVVSGNVNTLVRVPTIAADGSGRPNGHLRHLQS